MAKFFVRSLIIAGLAPTAGCVWQDREALRQSLYETDRAWAQAIGGDNVDEVVAYWTDDATVYPGGRPPVAGKTSLRKMVTKNRATPGFSVTYDTDEVVVARSGDLGYTLGPYTFTVPGPDGQPVEHRGHYISTWRREHGVWRCMLEVHAPLPALSEGR